MGYGENEKDASDLFAKPITNSPELAEVNARIQELKEQVASVQMRLMSMGTLISLTTASLKELYDIVGVKCPVGEKGDLGSPGLGTKKLLETTISRVDRMEVGVRWLNSEVHALMKTPTSESFIWVFVPILAWVMIGIGLGCMFTGMVLKYGWLKVD